MADLALFVLLLILSKGIFSIVKRPESAYEFPVFMSMTFAIFIVPQCFSIINFPGQAYGQPVQDVLVMTMLCAAVCVFGYPKRGFQSLNRFCSTPMDERRLFHGGIVFLVVSAYCTYLISGMSIEESGGSAWTGIITIYHFFTVLMFPSFAILLRHAIKFRSNLSLLLALAASIPIIQQVVFSGRRETAVFFLLTIGVVLWCEKRFPPPRIAVIFMAFAAMLAIPATGKYRSAASNNDWSEVSKIDFIENFIDYFSRESILELRNASMVIAGTRYTGEYGLGVAYWDELVWRFVPAQIVGRDIKNFLMIAKDEGFENILGNSGYAIPGGSTITAMGDAFMQFGFFGCLVFLFPAKLFRTLWDASQSPNGVFSELMYIGIMTSAMRAVTHQTVDFLPGLVYQWLFMGGLWFYAKKSSSQISETGIIED